MPIDTIYNFYSDLLRRRFLYAEIHLRCPVCILFLASNLSGGTMVHFECSWKMHFTSIAATF